MKDNRIQHDPKTSVSPAMAHHLSSYALAAGDIVMARRGEVGRAALVASHQAGWLCGTGSFFLRFVEEVNREYLLLLFQTASLRSYLAGKAVGTTMVNLNHGILKAAPLQIPPLPEQHRILAKVDELMALCDRLEAARANREATRDRLAAASLARLDALDPEQFTAYTRFALDALPALTTRPEQIKRLRHAIINLALRGRLVEQDAGDEPAGELLRRITEEKARLTKLSEIGLKGSSPLSDSEQAFAPPCGWVWCRLGALAYDSDSGWSPQTENFPREGDAWAVLKVSAVSWDHFDPSANKQVLPRTEPRPATAVRKGDFLMSRANTAELIARAVLVEDEPQNLMMSDKIVRLRLTDYCNHRFPLLVNNYADFARSYYAANATGVSPSMKNVSRKTILDLPVPLPPLAEQNRIVARVNELMTVCDRLLDALLGEAPAPALTLMGRARVRS
jgi:type I restriction enzyme S subunit